METQLNRQCLEVLHAGTIEEFVRTTAKFGESMECHSMASMVVMVHSPYLTQMQALTNLAPEYVPVFENSEGARRDPIFRHCRHSSMPIVWSQGTYVEAGQPDLWDEQAAFGFRSGIAVAFHLPRDRHFVFGFNSDKRACFDRRARLGSTLDMQEFAAYAQAAAFDLLIPYPLGADRHLPAPGELDALRRSMDGLSDWEVGHAMGISEKEVLLRLRRATAKLGCATKYEAALRAIRLGLVDCS